MVEVSSMEIVGMADTSDIDRGFQRIGDNFNVLESQAESSNFSLGRLSETASKIGKTMVTLGTAGVAAMTGLAMGAPAVAPALAKIQNRFREMRFELAENLQPAFEWFATEGMNMLSGAASDLGSLVSGDFDKIENLIGKGSGAAIGFAIGAKFGHPFLGAALGAAAGDRMQNAMENIGNPDEVASSDIIIPTGIGVLGRDMPDEPDEDAGLLERGKYRVFQFFELITNALGERNIEEYIGKRQRTG